MRRFLTIPHEPLARFRLMSVWFAGTIAFLNVGFFALVSPAPIAVRWQAAAAAAALGLWWIYGFRHGGFPLVGWLVDAGLIVIVSAVSPMPSDAVGLFFAGIQFRALYVPRRQIGLLVASYGVARVTSIELAHSALSFGAFSPTAVVSVLGLTVIAVTVHLFVTATERHAAIKHALELSDERYRIVASATRDVVYDWNVATDTVEWTESMQHAFGFAPHEIGREGSWWMNRIHPADREALQRKLAEALADPHSDVGTVQYRVRRADESYAFVSGSMVVQRNPDGTPVRAVGSIRDITAEHLLQEQLRQAQKMEAVGQLAGGVAHDFNNLLTVVGGHVFMLEVNLERTPFIDKHLEGITRAADRAAALTKQMLAFSRKQLLNPTVLDLNAVVDETLEMMRPVFAEQIHIVTHLDPHLAPIYADAGQLGQVIVNLALNARDAMQSGGTLTIETTTTTLEPRPDDATATPLPAGEYVRLVMRDTGSGMDAQTLAHAFEPFFTTKPHGLGSGLGLATVYGIVKQSFGDIQAASTPGAGAAFTLHLPIASQPAESIARLPARLEGPRAPRPRHVLLVEDDDGVREFGREVLERAGYRVHAARNGADALAQIRSHELSLDVVVTDVVMPEMGGREMVEQLRRWRPDLPVLYVTGYTDDARMLDELRATDARLLEKPFTASALASAVAEVSQAVVRAA